jgi:hypothetical protein
VEFIQPDSWQEALEGRATYSGVKPVLGGTGIRVDLNEDGRAGKDKR